MSKRGLDAKDIQLLRALKTNARASLVSLARDIDLSRSSTHDRITRLEELGVIKGYTINIDRTQLPLTRAFLTIRFSAGSSQNELAQIVHQMLGVEAAYCLSGDLDMFVYCECESVEELSELRDQLAQHNGVTEITTRQVLASSVS
ncbi:Lrp/AsnC family transcriptional regulator [Parasphingorhabdus cellanae]|uniref:Lrp/AsnC family transcriptional regulator n=1 Tax=Parasphingorhabdus cellanae TaxID=2806553 RepID=A0ABX7T0F5_9SPHN|nr:Lrp/AsnC family transcriptional regulator [Parasphingorhabdus cellanae]QTD55021.1 Lrp/AsnC family transcriptional regulator [Parasphingorhabdus cellanae]